AQPLVVEGRVIGALSIYTADPEAFDGEELELLEELAEDLAYAIGVLRSRIRHGETEENLRRSEEKFRTLFHNTSDAIFIHDIEGRILEANQASVNCLGYSHDHLLRLSIADVEAPQTPWAGRIEELSKRGGMAFESTYLTHGGAPVPVEVVSQLIEFEGQLAVLSTARDITERQRAREERKRFEDHLRRSQKMEAIGTLAGGIAHDFNNILGAILGYAEIMEVFDVPQDSPLYANVREVIKAAHRARELVQQILTFSRQTETEPKPVEVGLIVKEVLKFLRASLPSTIEIHRSLEARTKTILADPTKIHQLLMNLCTNAGHAMTEKGGTLRVELTETVLDHRGKECFPDLAPGAYLQLTVSDTGHGMTPETVERIFDPYFTTKRRGEGTGLGLAIVHGIVKSYGGGIAVESAPGKGSVFRILFPKVEDRPVEAETDRGLLPRGDERILMVDDEDALARTGKRILERLGYRVTAMTSSLDALEAFRAEPEAFDLLVTDLTMPQMTGTELARELLDIRPDLPIILCTGYSQKLRLSEAEEAGIRRIIEKPFGVRHLAEGVREVLDGNGA
ncbi:MAG: ATP-binding protein, partial [Acidobacteriota bacterium]